MVRLFQTALAIATVAVVQAQTLNDVCTSSYIESILPTSGLYLADGTYIAITVDTSSVTATPYTNYTARGSPNYPDATFDYCDVGFAYSHTGRANVSSTNVRYWLPAPSKFQNRYLSTGGGGYAINSGTSSLPGGVQYGAVSGITDGGFGSFSTNFDAVYLQNNGTPHYPLLYAFGYQAIHELTVLGQTFTKSFYNMSDSTKLYSYYQGCSEGGREGWSQVQRFTALDGVITGAPAFRFAHQQVQHLYSNVVEQTLDYYPPTCELAKIVNETISFCDPLDGKTDGVVARTDLCKLQFNVNSTIGKAYSCAAFNGSQGPGLPPHNYPAQNGTVTAQGAAVAAKILDGLVDSQGRRAYFSYQPSATFADASTLYNTTSKEWGLDIIGFGGDYVSRFITLVNQTNFSNLTNVTYDTLRDWMYAGWTRYEDTLQTTNPDLTKFQASGGKVLHYHGEADNSIPTASSVRYYESVRSIMYPNLSYNESVSALGDWYRLFLVPGAGHCGPNALQANGPFPQTNLAVLIDWVENDVAPATLNGTVLRGANAGQNQQICAWPLRPYWNGNATNPECQYNQALNEKTWHFDLDAFKLPVY